MLNFPLPLLSILPPFVPPCPDSLALHGPVVARICFPRPNNGAGVVVGSLKAEYTRKRRQPPPPPPPNASTYVGVRT